MVVCEEKLDKNKHNICDYEQKQHTVYVTVSLSIDWIVIFHPEAARMAMKLTRNGNMTGALTVNGKPALKCMFQK